MSHSVFLLGDIGSDSEGYFHIGDEAMWYENYLRYQDLDWSVIASSRSPEKLPLQRLTLIPDLYIPDTLSLQLALQSPTAEQLQIIEAVQSAEHVHISGGGNMNSIWPGHLYYRLFIIELARRLGKRVIVTSQTVGPMDDKDVLASRHILPYVDYFGIRDSNESLRAVLALGLNPVQIKHNADDAIARRYLIGGSDVQDYIGISLHGKVCENIDVQAGVRTLSLSAAVRAIPHVLYKKSHEMKLLDLSSNFSDVRYTNDSYVDTLTQTIRATQNARLNLTTRYHAAVFSLMAGRPTMCFYTDDYYKIKFQGLLEAFGIEADNCLFPLADLGHTLTTVKDLNYSDTNSSLNYLNAQISKLETKLENII